MTGRRPRKSIDYAGWSVDLFDTDTKIDKLLNAQGWTGFGVYFYLCMRAYGSEGYFYPWSYDDCATTARKMGGGISSGTVRETVGYCLQIGLFDKGLFDRWGILTSRGIQRRFWDVTKTRDIKKVISEYWLLQKEECKGLIVVPKNDELSTENSDNSNFAEGNNSFLEGNSSFPSIKESKVKESKGKESKEEQSDCTEPDDSVSMPAPILTFPLKDQTEHSIFEDDVKQWAELYPGISVMQELRKMKGWLIANPNRRKTKQGIQKFIHGWLAKEQDKGGSNNGINRAVTDHTPQSSRKYGLYL